MTQPFRNLLPVLLILLCAGPSLAAPHPLDPLTSDEIERVNDIVSGALGERPLYLSIRAQRPDKGASTSVRTAEVVYRHRRQHFDARVDLEAGRLTSAAVVDVAVDGHPGPLFAGRSGVRALWRSAGFREAIEARGLSEGRVHCEGQTISIPEVPRAVRYSCFETSGYHWYGRPIAGLYVTVDLDSRRVLDVTDRFAETAPPPLRDRRADEYRHGAIPPRGPLAPLVRERPSGTSIELDGSVLKWDIWQMHLGFDARVGTVLSDVRVKDGRRLRSVARELALSELFVPYMDPGDWHYRVLLDAGEYGIGRHATPLVRGMECPHDATYLSPVIPRESGSAVTMEDGLCVFELPLEAPAWRHFDDRSRRTESRPARALVVRMAATLGNYDYLLDQRFFQDGRIELMVGATGIVASQGVATRHMDEAQAATETRYGTLVAPGLVAVNHDHYFAFRLDLDVDGVSNNFDRLRLVAATPDAGSARTSIWQVVPERPGRELDAVTDIDLRRPAIWRFSHASRRNRIGNPTSYEIVPLGNVAPLVNLDDPGARRAGFIAHHLWVTPHDPAQRFAAGRFVLGEQSPGLPEWTRANRPVQGRDIVAWYTLGFHHVPRAEDWPVMPVTWKGVRLRPRDFFDRNPALDLHDGREASPPGRAVERARRKRHAAADQASPDGQPGGEVR